MKIKIKILFIYILAFLFLGIINPIYSYAEQPIIKDLAVETQDSQVKISITANTTNKQILPMNNKNKKTNN